MHANSPLDYSRTDTSSGPILSAVTEILNALYGMHTCQLIQVITNYRTNVPDENWSMEDKLHIG